MKYLLLTIVLILSFGILGEPLTAEEKIENKGDVLSYKKEIGLINNKKEIAYEYSLTKYIFKTILALGIIGMAIFIIIKLFVKSPRNLIKNEQGNFINLLGSIPIAHNKYLQLVEVAEKVLLLGVTENSINILTEIIDKEKIDIIKTNQSKILGENGFPFRFYLGKMLDKFKLEKKELSLKDKVNFIDKQKNRLKKLYFIDK
jgi:flagellar biogenesis protein FliO